jgi:hypothetical protein
VTRGVPRSLACWCWQAVHNRRDGRMEREIIGRMQKGNRRDYGDPMLVSPQVRIPTEDRHPELNPSHRQAAGEIVLSRETLWVGPSLCIDFRRRWRYCLVQTGFANSGAERICPKFLPTRSQNCC